MTEPVPDWIRNWQGDGILARINDKRMLRLPLKLPVPIVDLRRSLKSARIPQVGPDDVRATEMVFEHFRQRGFQRFAFVGIPCGEHDAMDTRRRHFRNLAVRRKYPFAETEITMSDFGKKEGGGESRLIRWLKKLPERSAILACNGCRSF